MTFQGAVVSVGGSPEPIAVSLNEAKPGFVLFVVSHDSKAEVENKILPRLSYSPQYNYAVTPNPGDVAACYEAVRKRLQDWLEERGLGPGQVYVDITGGTKPMSSGLAMASAERLTHICYVTGKERDKAGLGVVISGTEYVLFTSNPWDKLATRERDRATWLFRNGYPQAAADLLREASKKCNRELQQELLTLAALADLFADVDRFHFRDLKTPYEDHCEALCLLFSHRSKLDVFGRIEQAAAHWQGLQAELYSKGAKVAATLRELLANAERRAQQARYDDAIARLYRAAELFAHGKLYEAFQAKLGKVHRHQIPEEHRDEWMRTFRESEEAVYKLGVKDAFRALALSGNPEHRAIADSYESIRNHLHRRNDSILAHGVEPCTKDAFNALWGALLPTVRVREEEIPRWPRIDF